MIVANGHPYDRSAFMRMFETLEGAEAFIVDHPVAATILNVDGTTDVDAIVLYDMPGGDPFDGPGYSVSPDEDFKRGFLELLDRGMPIVALHHAIGAWSLWDEYSELLGGKVLHYPGLVRGRECLDSGYRQDVRYTISPVATDHPLFDGLPVDFEIEDEVFLMECFEDSITPLVRSSYSYEAKSFYSIAQIMSGKGEGNDNWLHPPGSNIIGWTKMARNSPLVYLQPGHGPAAYSNPNYVRLLHNAIRWTIAECECHRAVA